MIWKGSKGTPAANCRHRHAHAGIPCPQHWRWAARTGTRLLACETQSASHQGAGSEAAEAAAQQSTCKQQECPVARSLPMPTPLCTHHRSSWYTSARWGSHAISASSCAVMSCAFHGSAKGHCRSGLDAKTWHHVVDSARSHMPAAVTLTSTLLLPSCPSFAQ